MAKRDFLVSTKRNQSQKQKKEGGKAKPKTKPKSNTTTEYGSGMVVVTGGGPTKKKKPRPNLPRMQDVENDVLKSIVGQDEQVRQIITAVYRSIKFQRLKTNILIVGASGTGKTETVTQVAKRLNIPYTVEDATKYTQEGYYGNDVEDMIFNLLDNADLDYEAAEHGMLIIDEIDKKCGHEQHDVAGVEVLKSLLKVIEGTTIKVPLDIFGEEIIDFDTSNLIVVFLGAFEGLDQIRKKRLNTNALGFATPENSSEIKRKNFIKQDFINYGMPKEFIGRIDEIVEMNDLTVNDLATILRSSKLSIFRRYQYELRNLGVTLDYDGKLFALIAEESLELDTGARELTNTVNYIFEKIVYDVLAHPHKFSKCKLELNIINDNSSYTLS